MKVVIDYKPHSRQQLFHKNKADEILYGGAAGGGKSIALLIDALKNATKYAGCKIIMFRRTFPELERSLILESRKIYPKEIGKYNDAKKRWTFINGSIIEFAYLDREADVYNYQGAEYDFIYFDELTHFTETQYTYMLSRLRGTNPNIHRQVKSATNPGGVGHVWVKARFIDPAPPEVVWKPEPSVEDPNPGTRCFIPAKLTDNLALMQADPGYLDRLNRLDEKTRKQLRDGDWDVFAGQFFDEWRRDIHVIKPFAIPDHWTKIRAIDDGYAKPFACLWLAFDEEGNCYVYRELKKARLLSSEQAEMIKQMTPPDERINYSVADTAMWIKGRDSGISPAEVYTKHGVPLMQATKDRVNGWKRVREYLKVYKTRDKVTGEEKETSSLFVFDTCLETIKDIPSLIHDETNPEDLDTDMDDHIADALRYGLMSRPPKSKPIEGDSHLTPQQRWLKEMEKRHFQNVKLAQRRMGR